MPTQSEVFAKVVDVVSPFAKNRVALENVSDTTTLLGDLKVNSARLVDIILKLEDEFDIEIDDDDADNARTVGDAVSIIRSKLE